MAADGTTVAYASAGAGRPLVYVMGWLTHLRLGWELPAERALYEALAEIARYQRACSSAATARALLALSCELDVSDHLGRVRAPTLVVHRTGDRAAPVAQAEAQADGIDGARLALLPGRSHLAWAGDRADLVRAVRRFLGLPVPRRRPDGLTARQREVADLVSQGCTNREIAARLGIDERSAEGHVERIRLRLGFRSRAQIAAWFRDQL